jgi:hypothetical protein
MAPFTTYERLCGAKAEAAARAVAWLTEQGMPFRALWDGEAFIA